MAEMVVCDNCETELDAGVERCSECGQSTVSGPLANVGFMVVFPVFCLSVLLILFTAIVVFGRGFPPVQGGALLGLFGLTAGVSGYLLYRYSAGVEG